MRLFYKGSSVGGPHGQHTPAPYKGTSFHRQQAKILPGGVLAMTWHCGVGQGIVIVGNDS